MNIIIRKLIEWRVTPMLTKIWGLVDGKKAYLLGAATILVAIVGKLVGPVDIGAIKIPAYDWGAFWALVWQGVAVIVGKSALAKIEPKGNAVAEKPAV